MKATQNYRPLKKVAVRLALAASLAATPLTASALNIVLSNDDGLTSNIKALYKALKTAGHDVIVSTPCQGQSGMGAAIIFLEPLTPLTQACLNNAATAGDAGAGPVTKVEKGFNYSDFSYVNGTPIMATAYGLDILAPARWGSAPDLVISGPNQGQNVGSIVISSGTVSNVQFTAGRGISAIALSAGENTEGKEDKSGNHADNRLSLIVADHAVALLSELVKKSRDKPILPAGLALNVNFPDEVTSASTWSFSRIGSYDAFGAVFTEDLSKDPVAQSYGIKGLAYPSISLAFNTEKPTPEQREDESVVYKTRIAVSAMQVAYDHSPSGQQWLRNRLQGLFDQ
jgi:5'-nucleotidase